MNTTELIDKYRKILSKILKCDKMSIGLIYNNKPIDIYSFFIDKEKGNQTEMRDYRNFSLGDFKIKLNDNVISTFSLYQFPCCCAFMISTTAFVTPEFRNKGIGTVLNSMRQDIGRILGYSAVLCTDIEQNIHQRKLLKTNGWKDIHNIINKRTNNRVYLSVINI